MGETDLHRNVMFDLIGALAEHHAGQQVYVSGNLLLFYEPGNKRKHISPDVLVTKGLQPGLRKNYILWQEGLPPNFVIEVTSESTRREDLKTKFDLYQDVIRVPEYYLFDPYGEYLTPALQGHRLDAAGRYAPILLVNGRMASEQLGLDLEPGFQCLRLIDRQTGQPLLTAQERADKVAEESERQRASDADEIARLKVEIDRLRQTQK